jgi:hypothetical protein
MKRIVIYLAVFILALSCKKDEVVPITQPTKTTLLTKSTWVVNAILVSNGTKNADIYRKGVKETYGDFSDMTFTFTTDGKMKAINHGGQAGADTWSLTTNDTKLEFGSGKYTYEISTLSETNFDFTFNDGSTNALGLSATQLKDLGFTATESVKTIFQTIPKK